MVIVAGLATACASTAQTDMRADDIAKITEAKLKTWPAIYDVRDADWLDRFLNDDFVFIDDTGAIETKAETLEWMRANPLDETASGQPDDFVYTIKDILFLNPDVAMVYGHGDSTRTTKTGKPCAHNYWSSNILRRVRDEWKPSFSHVSGVSCKPIS